MLSCVYVCCQLACAVEHSWVAPLLPRLDGVDTDRLLGRASKPPSDQAGDDASGLSGIADDAQPAGKRARTEDVERRNDTDAVSAARQRFLQRRAAGSASAAPPAPSRGR